MAHDEQIYVDGWQTYSNWLDDLRDNHHVLSNFDNNSKFKSDLTSAKTIYDKFKLFWLDNKEFRSELKKVYNEDLKECDRLRSNRVEKSVQESAKMRELGNKSFKDGNHKLALNQYSLAVKFAPYPKEPSFQDLTTSDKEESTALSLALANRSAALYALTRYRLCLLDIDLALKYGYPEANKFKLLTRKVRCLHILSVWTNDVEQIKDELKDIRKNSETKEFIKAEINSMFEFIEQTQPEEMVRDELDVVDETSMKLSNVSKTISQAADCVEMSYETEKGRYLLTNKDVSFGRLLVAEEPYVCNLAPSKRNDYCYNCFAKLHSCGIGCKQCTQVLYCSENCIEANSNIHKYECNKLLDFQDQLGVAYLVTHLIFKTNFNPNSIPIYTRKVVTEKSLDDVLNMSPMDWPDLIYKNDYAAVLSLMDHVQDYDHEELTGHSMTAVYLLIAFMDKFSNDHKNLQDEQNQLIIGSLILKHLLQLQTNLISILDQNLQDLVSSGRNLFDNMIEQPIGVGIYPTISLLNHSCSPNILSIFHRNKFIARASRSLECGSEINYCYGPSITRMSKKDRQRRLKDQYFFECQCDCCVTNKENESRALLCPECGGPVIYNLDMSHNCLKCCKTNILDIESSLKKLHENEMKLNQLKECDIIDFAQKIEKYKAIESELKKIVYWRHPLFEKIKSDLVECAEILEDLDSALIYCSEEFDLCSQIYGKDSFECITTELKFVNLKWQKLYDEIEEMDDKPKGIEELKSLLNRIHDTRIRLKELLNSTNILGAESSFEDELKFLSSIITNINNYISSLNLQELEVDDKAN